MDKEVKKDIISVLTQSLFLIKKQDFASLKELSDHVVHTISIMQDSDSIQVAVVTYSLSKILERAKNENRNISEGVISTLQNAIDYLTHDNDSAYRNEIKKVLGEISKTDEKLLMYIQNVIEQANIVKGSKIYRHGISLGRVSEILGISQWELMSFIGKTRITDEEGMTPNINSRLAFAKKLFKVP